MRQSAVACAVLLAATVFVVVRGAPYDDVELRSGGVLSIGGERVGLDSLRRECRGRTAVTLRVGDDVPWGEFEVILFVLQDAGVRRVRFDSGGDAVLVSDYWRQDVRGVPGGHYRGVIRVRGDELADPDLASRLKARAEAFEGEYGLQPLGQVLPEPSQSFAAVAPALRAFQEAGVELEIGVLGNFTDPPVELPDDEPVVFPDSPAFPLAWCGFRCWCWYLPGVDVPVADMGERETEQEEDDRLTLELDREGNIIRPRSLSLDDLAALLRDRRARYDLKMTQQGKSGLLESPDGGQLSKLYVLICADRLAPARHVGWVLHVLAEEGFYKVQYAVWRGPEADPGPCAEKAKIQVWLPTDNLPAIVSGEEPTIHVYVGPDSYGVDAAQDLDVGGLRGPLTDHLNSAWAKPGQKVLAALHVAPEVAWERVVAAVNELARAGIERVDFRGLPRPDEATRRMKPLPR